MSSKAHEPCQLKDYRVAERSEAIPSWVLDLELYRAAISSGAPIPPFNRLKRDGQVGRDVRRDLRAGRVVHVLNSGLSPEFYEEAHGVDARIVRHLREVHARGLLATRDDRLHVERQRGAVRVVRL